MKNVKINQKWDILLPDHRADRPEWNTEKGWERERIDSLYKHLRADDVVYYVGAEEGDMAGLISLWGIENIVLFEPNDKVWPNIKAIWDANKLKTPHTFNGFASSISTSMQLRHGFPLSANDPLISDHGFKELQDPGYIPQIRLDDVPYSKPTAICMDVEGSEWEVLKGAKDILANNHPQLWISIHPEFMFRIYGQYQYELRKWIKDFGYKEEILAYEHELHVRYYV